MRQQQFLNCSSHSVKSFLLICYNSPMILYKTSDQWLETLDWITDCVFIQWIFPPLCQCLALVVSGSLQVSLQAFLLRLELLCIVGLQALAGADILQLFQQFLLLVDKDEAISLWVEKPRPCLAVQLGDLNLDGGNPAQAWRRDVAKKICYIWSNKHFIQKCTSLLFLW